MESGNLLPEEKSIKTNVPLIHKLESGPPGGRNLKPLIFLILIIAGGIFSGYLLSKFSVKSGPAAITEQQSGKDVPKIAGSEDTTTFPDSTEGDLEAGGLNGEGTHKLIRPGGESQTVYLTSSVLDLNSYTGKKVRVWGQTFAAQKAGWLMDVGKVEVLN